MNPYINKFDAVRQYTLDFCKELSPEDMVVQVMLDASPIKWHLAHTTWFFETFLLKKFYPNYKEFHPEFNFLFNSYYESVGVRLLRTDRGNITRPSVNEILEYRAYVNAQMFKLLTEIQISDEILMFLELGLQHEQQHQELMVTDLKYVFGTNPTFPTYTPFEKQFINYEISQPTIPDFTKIPEGVYEVGYNSNSFCFDNELPAHKVFINPVEVCNSLVSNADFLEFINDGGYEKPHLWLQEGWSFIKENNVSAPLYWFKGKETDEQYYRYSFTEGLIAINEDKNSPVCHISYYEAQAYANWKGMRLPTEFEWEVWAKLILAGDYSLGQLDFEDDDFEDEENLDLSYKRETHFPYDPKTKRSLEVMGNVWNWTQSSYLPYPGYKQEAGALGEYNGKFMVNQMVLRGSSCATTPGHSRISYRNFFHPDKQWQFTGIRLAKDV